MKIKKDGEDIIVEKTTEELELYANGIISSLEKLNIAEKWAVISSLYFGLLDTLKQLGYIIVENEKDDTNKR